MIPRRFDDVCSNYDALPIATAVSASAAFPILLTPVAFQNFSKDCAGQLRRGDWIRFALSNEITRFRSLWASAGREAADKQCAIAFGEDDADKRLRPRFSVHFHLIAPSRVRESGRVHSLCAKSGLIPPVEYPFDLLRRRKQTPWAGDCRLGWPRAKPSAPSASSKALASPWD